MWAKVRDWWWMPGIIAAVWLAWPEMREWGIWAWVGFVLVVAFTLVVYSALFVSGTISQLEDAREWEREQARERARECARRMVELGICEDKEEAA